MEIPTDLNFQLAGYRPTINHFVLQSIAMGITAFLIPGLRITSFFGPITTVIALAAVNATVWNAQLFFSLPMTLTESALSIVLANAVLFWVLVKVLPGIEIKGILPSIVAPIVFTVINMAAYRYVRDVDFVQLGQQGISVVEHYRSELMGGSSSSGGETRSVLDSLGKKNPFPGR